MTDGTTKPIARVSRALLPTGENYSQIEKEALGIIFAVSKFHRFIHEYINWIKTKVLEKDQRTEDVFSTFDDALLYRECVVIPSTLKKFILKDFYDGHPGSNGMKSLIRSFVYWPNVDKDIENAVKLCKGCALDPKAPPIKFNSLPKTDLPWSRIHIDFIAPLEGFYYSIVVDSCSN